jgi:hypothetical protein
MIWKILQPWGEALRPRIEKLYLLRRHRNGKTTYQTGLYDCTIYDKLPVASGDQWLC